MLRTLTNLDQRSNLNLCGNTAPFCYPMTRPGDAMMYHKLPPSDSGWSIFSISLYTQDFGSLIHIFYVAPTNFVDQFFSYVIAQDSNGDWFIAIRPIQPFYNYDGIQSEITCFSLGFTLTDGTDEFTFGTEPACYITSYTVNQYTILADIADIALLTFYISCDGATETTEYTYQTLPAGYWIEYTGPFIDLFIPENCELVDVLISGYEQVFEGPVERTFGADGCNSYARLTGYGSFRYDCKGRYFGTIDEDTITVDNQTQLIMTGGGLDVSLMPINVQNTQTKTLANRSTPKRDLPSCYIPSNEWYGRYKITSNCPAPAWFVEEVNNIASLQSITIEGSNPVADDYGDLIPVVQSDEYQWKERATAIDFIPQLFFETCVCYRNFVC